MTPKFVFFAFLLILFSSASVFAQGGPLPEYTDGGIYLTLTNSYSYDAGGGRKIDGFVAEIEGPEEDMGNLVFLTGAGVIRCGDVKSRSLAQCELETDGDLNGPLSVASASVTISGKRYKVTNVLNYDYGYAGPVTVIISPRVAAQADSASGSDAGGCPDKREPLAPVTGVFQSYECGDYCHLSLKLDDGTESWYIAGEQAQEQLDAPGGKFRPGTKVRVSLEAFQSSIPESPDECFKDTLATGIYKAE
jgi:hypothetical protein